MPERYGSVAAMSRKSKGKAKAVPPDTGTPETAAKLGHKPHVAWGNDLPVDARRAAVNIYRAANLLADDSTDELEWTENEQRTVARYLAWRRKMTEERRPIARILDVVVYAEALSCDGLEEALKLYARIKLPLMKFKTEEVMESHDSFSEKGAARIAGSIEGFWSASDKAVKTKLEPFVLGQRVVYAVRSDMVNGLPRE